MTWTLLATCGLIAAAIPALMFLRNLQLFLPPRLSHGTAPQGEPPKVSVLIPARDEASGIADAVHAAVASEGVEIEVVVLDDHSTDDTAKIVTDLGRADRRVRLVHGKELPAGWNGKQFACYQLAAAAAYDRWVFIDADVRLRGDGVRRLIAHQDASESGLLSAFPRQVTGTWLEQWLIPMMHFILLGFLPIARMRQSRHPAYAAGCGQLFVTSREAYRQAGTHEALRGSRHDGLKLPMAYRRNGLSTDIVDGTEIASCRMYRGAGQVVRGLLKNASEGIASPRLILPFTIILLGGALLPWVTLVGGWRGGEPAAVVLSVIAIALAHLPRLVAAARFRQSWLGAICQTPAVVTFVALQWWALVQSLLGRQVAWRGRA
jgi:hypothetical protein